MLNLVRYVKTDPAIYLIQYRKGKLRRQGSGLSFFEGFAHETENIVRQGLAGQMGARELASNVSDQGKIEL